MISRTSPISTLLPSALRAIGLGVDGTEAGSHVHITILTLELGAEQALTTLTDAVNPHMTTSWISRRFSHHIQRYLLPLLSL